jgi:hypothetical protein
MLRRTKITLLAAMLSAACGTEGGPGGGASHLPVSGAGPFAPLDAEPGDLIDAPVVLSDPSDLDDPVVFADGDALTVWLTAHRSAGDDIERADAKTIRQGFGDLEVALTADQAWEGGGVSAPSVVRDQQPWLLFYLAAGGIGYATSTDGHTWEKQPGPVLPGVAGPPAAVRIGDKIRVYYPKNGAIYASESATLTDWTDLGELVAGVPFGTSLGRVFARAADTEAGRLRHDLYFTVETGVVATPSTCGFASSWDGVHFDEEATAIVDAKLVTGSPTETPYGDGALLLWIERHGARAVVTAGKSP